MRASFLLVPCLAVTALVGCRSTKAFEKISEACSKVKMYTLATDAPRGYTRGSEQPLDVRNVVKIHYEPMDKKNTYVTFNETYNDVNADKTLQSDEVIAADLTIQKGDKSIAYHYRRELEKAREAAQSAVFHNIPENIESNFEPMTLQKIRHMAYLVANANGAEEIVNRQHRRDRLHP